MGRAGQRHAGRSRLQARRGTPQPDPVARGARCALSAAELQEALARDQRSVSRASVYRILEELERAELVARIEVGQGIVRFEPIRHGAGHHHHLVCDHCGRLIPFSDEGLERELERVSERVPLVVAEHDVILRGECAACSEHT